VTQRHSFCWRSPRLLDGSTRAPAPGRRASSPPADQPEPRAVVPQPITAYSSGSSAAPGAWRRCEVGPEWMDCVLAMGRVMSIGFRPAAARARTDGTDRPGGRSVRQLSIWLLTASRIWPLSDPFPLLLPFRCPGPFPHVPSKRCGTGSPSVPIAAIEVAAQGTDPPDMQRCDQADHCESRHRKDRAVRLGHDLPAH
jgi:hypothetical protein